MDGAVVRALASHHCVSVSIPGPGVICGLSLLLTVVGSLPRSERLSPGTPVSPSPQNQHFQLLIRVDYCQALYYEPLAR